MDIITALMSILGGAFIGGFIAQRIKLPLVVGYLFAGLVFSWFWGNIFVEKNVNSIASIGVALLMFTLGLEFSLNRLKNLGQIIIFGSIIQILLTIIFGIIFFQLLGFDFYNSLFLGGVFALSSTAVVVKILSDKGELDTLSSEIAVGWLLIQDLATLPLIILLPSFGRSLSGGGIWWSILTVARGVSISIILLIFIFLLGRKVVPHLLDTIAQTKVRELLLISVVAICLLFALVFQSLGFSFALGAFLAGLIIASSSTNQAIFSEIRPLRDIFSIVFFVSLGILMNIQFLLANILFIIELTIIVMMVKFLISMILVLFLGYHSRTAFIVGISLVSIGEFAFILARLGIDQNLISYKTYMTVLSVAMFSLAISSPFMLYANRIYRTLRKFISEKLPLAESILNRYDRNYGGNGLNYSDHVVILGHGRVGKYISKALYASNISYVVVDYNNQIVKNLRKMGVEVIYGDSSEIDVLKAARIDTARVIIIALPDSDTQLTVAGEAKRLNPNIKIICRSHHDEDRFKLKNLGVNAIIQPEFEAAISITGKLLKLYDKQNQVIEDKINSIKREYAII